MLYGGLGAAAFLTIGLAPISSVGVAGVLLFVVNLGIWGPDVIIDGANAERFKTHPSLASDLQTLSWGSLAAFGILAGLSGGVLQGMFGARKLPRYRWHLGCILLKMPAISLLTGGVFVVASLASLAVAVPAGLGWMKEERVTSRSDECGSLRDMIHSPVQGPVFVSSPHSIWPAGVRELCLLSSDVNLLAWRYRRPPPWCASSASSWGCSGYSSIRGP